MYDLCEMYDQVLERPPSVLDCIEKHTGETGKCCIRIIMVVNTTFIREQVGFYYIT